MDHVHQNTKYAISLERAFHERFRWLRQFVLRVLTSHLIFSVLNPIEYISGINLLKPSGYFTYHQV